MLWANCNHKETRQLQGGLVGRMARAGLALCLTVAFIPAPALASSAGEDDGTAEVVASPDVTEAETVEVVTAEETYVPDPDLLPDSDELFAGYVERTFYGSNDIMLLGDYGTGRLDGLDQRVYTALKDKIEQVANGNLASTQFKLAWDDLGVDGTSLSSADLSAESLGTYDVNNKTTTLSEAARKWIDDKTSFDFSTVIDCLLVDCPYELYWYQKNVGCTNDAGRYQLSYSGETGSISSISLIDPTFSFAVANAYADTSEGTITMGSKQAYVAVDQNKTGATTIAVNNARAVVSENVGKSDYQKIVAYKEYICEAVSYNTAALESGNTGDNADAWQLIYVFDGDSSTNVVCEGYSKAFQYLCDLSQFSGKVACYTVSGTMGGGTGAGNHMWNIVSIDDSSYLVDVTNCDGDATTYTAGYPNRLFLVGATEGSLTGGYSVHLNQYYVSDNSYLPEANITYSYDDDTKILYGNETASILNLSFSNYEDVLAESMSIYGATLTLDGSIGVNFYVDMSSIDEGARSSYKMRFKVNDADVDSASYGSSATNTFGDAVYHRFTCSVNSCQMNDTITAQLYCGDTPVSKAYTYSVKTYADHMISADSNSELVSLVKAMLNYGGYAQTKFPDVGAGVLANSGLTEVERSLNSVTVDVLAGHESSSEGNADLNISASLVLNSETAIRFYFTPAEGKSYTFTVDDTEVTPKEVDSSSDGSNSGSGATHYIEIPNIAASQLDTRHTLSVNDGSSTMTLSYSALSYVYDVLRIGSTDVNYDVDLQNLVKALYLYNQAANAYFGA